MTGNLLLRGMIAGLVAALFAFCVAYVYGEPEVNYAISLEEQMAAADAGHDHGAEAADDEAAVAVHSHGDDEEEIVSRAMQSTGGLAIALLVYGAAVGGILSIVFAFAYGRLSALGARATSALLALAGFVSAVLVPQFKYPATPPAVGDPETINARTALFFAALVLSVALAVAAIALARRLRESLGAWTGGTVAAVLWLLASLAVMSLLPAVDEVPAEFAASSLWHFRLASLGIHATLWAVIGLVFGWLAEREIEPARTRHPNAGVPAH